MEVIRKNNNGQFDLIRWLALAASKDQGKPSLRTINIREDTATATDGHVLNQYNGPLGTIEPGLWEVVKVTKSEIHLQPSEETFPDTDSVWPDTADLTKLTLFGHDLKGRSGGSNLFRDFAAIVRGISPKVALSYDLFKIAAENAEMTTALVNPKGSSAVLLQNGVRSSLIMPIRMGG